MKKEIIRGIAWLGIPLMFVLLYAVNHSARYDELLFGANTMSFAEIFFWGGVIMAGICGLAFIIAHPFTRKRDEFFHLYKGKTKLD